MAKRKSLTKKMRYEVFKRDKFTCQYCGRTAPDVVLEVDHIHPVSKGGTNDILNLVTSCKDCNRGKGDRTLSDDSVVKKQQEQLLELADKREQIDMMVQWKEELSNLDEYMVDKIDELFQRYCKGSLKESTRKQFGKLIEKYGFSEVYESTLISIKQYVFYEGDQINHGSVLHCIRMVSGICKNRKESGNDPLIGRKKYLIGIARNKGIVTTYAEESRVMKELSEMEEDDFEELRTIFCEMYEGVDEDSIFDTTLDELIYYIHGMFSEKKYFEKVKSGD